MSWNSKETNDCDIVSPVTRWPTMERQVSEPDANSSRNSEDELAQSGCSRTAVRCPAYHVSQDSSAGGSNSQIWLDSLTLYQFEDWSMLSCCNSNLGQLTDSTNELARPIEDIALPERISCLLYITFEKQKVANPPKEIVLQMNDSSTFSEINSAAEACVRERFEGHLAGKSLNYRHGECTLFCDNGDRHIHMLSSQEEWKDICNLVKVCIANRRLSFHLEIQREYFSLSTSRNDEDSLASLKRMEIFRLMQTAFDGRRYIALTDLSRVTSTEVIRQILEEDPVPNLKPFQKNSFTDDVLRSGRKLLAMCVYAQLRMKCLKTVMDKGYDDNSLLETPLVDDDCCHEKCQPSFAALVQWQGGFSAAEFLIPGQNQFFGPSTVVPIHYHPNQRGLGHASNEALSTKIQAKRVRNDDHATSRQNACCGTGAYSNVYRVKIDPAHHRLSKNRSVDFALKEFKDRPLRVGADFNKELDFLYELRKNPNDHLVTHLSTWTQDGRYYMLFPYAQCNLRQYMIQKAFGTPRKENTSWLLHQIYHLATALKHIHNLSNANSQLDSSKPSTVPLPDLRTSGWHHDIKPENILYFRTLTSSGGDFHIADFGSGKVHTYRSGSVNTSSPNGTPTYEPPEATKEGFTSRPYDIWSTGCVFLELLIWAIFDHKSLQSFASERQGRRFPGSHTDIISDDAYWQMTEDGDIRLRSSVSEWIKQLKCRLQEQKLQPLESVLELIERMLDTDRRTRITARDLCNSLHCI